MVVRWLSVTKSVLELLLLLAIAESNVTSELVNFYNTSFVGVKGPLGLPDVPGFGVK